MTERPALITYEVHYQSENRPNWFVLENPAYEHTAPSRMHAATHDFGEAQDVARALLNDEPYPLKPHRSPITRPVNAVRVIQHVSTGGEVIRYGTTHPDTDPDD